MPTRLLKLGDGTLVEISVDEDDTTGAFHPVAGGGVLQKAVDVTFDAARPLLHRVVDTWNDVCKELSTKIHIESAEVELGLSFEAEGNIYLTKSKAGATIGLKLCFKPPQP